MYSFVCLLKKVCSIGGTSDSLIVSGSWDMSAKVWEEQNCVATLTGHSASVWAVATVPGSVGNNINNTFYD